METGQGAGAGTTIRRSYIPLRDRELAARAQLVAPDFQPCPSSDCYRWWTMMPDDLLEAAAFMELATAPPGDPDERRPEPKASLPEALAMVREAYARLEADEDNPSRFATGAARLASIALQITRLQGVLKAESAGNESLEAMLARLFAGLDDAPAAFSPPGSGQEAVPGAGDQGPDGRAVRFEADDDWLDVRLGRDPGNDDFADFD